jgi:hypothetical protein
VAADSEKAWIIVALWNLGSPAFAGIDHLDVPPISAEINCGE